MKKFVQDLTVNSVEILSSMHVLLKLTAEESLPPTIPGQFVEVRVDNSPSTFLRRPISINLVDYQQNELWLLIAMIGDGTQQLGKLKVGDTLNCLYPLGNGFTLPNDSSEKILLIGGGVGIAPLLYLGHKIKANKGKPTFILGARTKNELLELDLFQQLGRVFITTEDGSMGEKGFVINHSILQKEKFSSISTCGPKPMMMSVAQYAYANDIQCEVSLENKMACGLGACLCCVEKTVDGNICICKEGPVLNIKKLLWQI